MTRKVLNEEEIKAMCKRMRLHAMDMALAAGNRGAHVSGSLSCMEIYAVLYGAILNYDIDNPLWNDRDRFIAGKEHARLAEYPARAEMGFYSPDVLNSYEQNDGLLVGHQLKKELGVEYGSINISQIKNPSYTTDRAFLEKSGMIRDIMGVDELATNSYHHQGLKDIAPNGTVTGMSVDGNTEELMAQRDMQKKMEAFGFEAVTVDGHDIHQLMEALKHKPEGMPYAIIAETTKGKGVSFIENNKSWHQAVLNEKQYQQAIEEINNKS